MPRVLLALLITCLSVGLKAQCPNPTNIIASNITASSVDIDLSANGTGPWEFEYGIVGFTLGTGTTLTATGTVVTITGLMPAQTYRVYIRKVCGTNFSSRTTLTITTNCGGIFNAPVRFDFEGPEWVNPSHPMGTSIMDSCWVLSPQGSFTSWSVGPSHDTRLNTGPEGDHTTGFGKFIHLNGLGISTDSMSTLKMPTVDLSGLNNPQFEFWYHFYGSGIDSLIILSKFSSITDWDTLHIFRGEQQVSQTDSWKKMTLSLSSYLDTMVDIQLVGFGGGTLVQMALDDISIHDSLSCEPVTYFRNVSNNNTSVLLDWDEGSSSSHEIEYGTAGFSIGNGIRIPIGQPPFRISSLTANTTYDVYIRVDCTGGKYSDWLGPLQVKTDCSPVYAPYFENFEDPSWTIGGLDACWDRYNYLDFKWNVGPPPLNYSQSGPGPNNHTPGGSKFIVADRPTTKGHARSSITSRLIDLDTIANPELVFWTHMFGLQILAFDVSIDTGNGYILLKRIIGPQQLSKSAAWTEQIIDLAGYGGKTVKLKFTGIAGDNTSALSRIAVDDVSIGEAPSCRKPTNLILNRQGYTSVDIGWLSGGASNWLIRLTSAGLDTIFPTTNNPLTLSQLQPGNGYTIWVKDSCGVGDVSEWSALLDIKTYCLPDTTPYWQDFEAPQFVVQTSYFSTGTLGACWERSHELGPIWQPSPATNFPNNLTPLSDHTSGSGKYIGGSLFLGNGTNEPTSFTSPHIDLTNLSNPQLSFWYFLGGYTFYTNQIQLEVNNGSGWQLMTTIYGPVQMSTTDPWQEQVVDLNAFKDDTVRLRFSCIGNNLYATSAGGIDDIAIYDDPICHSPADLMLQHVGTTNALLSWTSGGASDWVVKHRPSGGSAVYQTTSVNDSFALNGLTPGTWYEVWVRDSCGPDVSSWFGPIRFKTDCLPTQVPFIEDFEDASWVIPTNFNDPGEINNCWRRSDSLYNVWMPYTGTSPNSMSGPSGPRTGSGKYMMLEDINTLIGPGSSILELSTPLIINTGLMQPELNFWYHLCGQQIQSLKVYAEISDGTRIPIDSLIGQQQVNKTAPWVQRTIPLTAFQGDTLKFVFALKVQNILGRINGAIDDVEIVDFICSGPSNLSASNISFSSADLNWNSGSSQSKIQYGLAGFALGSGTVVSGITPGYNLTGLQPFTTYEYYVQDSCRASNSSWVGPFSFTTTCAPPVADFSHQGTDTTVSFNGSNSTGTALSYTWDFGDGNTGTGLNPTHNYAAGGLYSVTLIITDTCGTNDTLAKNVLVCDAPLAVINHTRNGLSVKFNGQSSVGAWQYYWDLGPAGVFMTDTFTAVFPAKGIYPIYLVVTNACGSKDTTFMKLVLCDLPKSTFSATISTFPSPQMVVYFDGTASVYVNKFIWFFGDGDKDSTSLTPVHAYATNSLNYLVTLVTFGDCGLTDTLSYTLSSISLDESSQPGISVYPNPTSSHVTVTSDDNHLSTADLHWFDVSGKELNVPLISEENGSFEFDVSKLAAGEYFLVNTLYGGRAVKVTVR